MQEWCLEHPWMTFFILGSIFFNGGFTLIRIRYSRRDK